MLLLLAYVLWVPLPFGSVVDAAQAPLILPPLLLCAVAAAIRAMNVARVETARWPAAYRFWTSGAALFAGVVALQLIPMPPALLHLLSPESLRIWSGSARVAALLTGQSYRPAAHPLSVDPSTTLLQLFRFLAYFAAFQAAALLLRRSRHRTWLAMTLCTIALFECLYGVREAALRRYAIWGWKNTLIFDRVTGTFVNPNHFAHHAAIILPMAIFLLADAWHAMNPAIPLRRRMVLLLEHRLVLVAFSLFAAVACLISILLAQSRGALLSLIGGACATALLGLYLSRRRAASVAPSMSRRSRKSKATRIALRFALPIGVALLLLAALIDYLGTERTIGRFVPLPSETATFVGRRVGIEAALGIWKRFPLFGSGFGTFADVVSLAQRDDLTKLYDHAHDDYVELAATTGVFGWLTALVPFIAGYSALARSAFRAGAASRFSRRAFSIAALTSLTIAMVHALFDFNFFIPANPATLAVILGAAVAVRD
jgi:hypothetical protein